MAAPHEMAVQTLSEKEGQARSMIRQYLARPSDHTSSSALPINPLRLAVEFNWIEEVSALLQANAPITQPDTSGYSPLQWAIKKGNFPLFHQLWKASQSRHVELASLLSTTTNHKECLLSLACQSHCVKTVRFLLEAGASSNGVGESHRPWAGIPLMCAVFTDSEEVLRLLLQRGVDVDQRDQNGWTALHYAVSNGHLATTTLLIEHHASPWTLTPDHETVLHLSVASTHRPLFQYLLRTLQSQRSPEQFQALLDQATAQGTTVILAALDCEHPEAVSDVLSHGPSLAGHRVDGKTALHLAAEKGYCQVLQQLLATNSATGAQESLADGTTSIGDSPLLLAAESGHLDCVETLLTHGVNANHVRRLDGATALFLAAMEGHAAIVKTLLHHGAKLSLKSPQTGAGPLFIASQMGHEEVLRLLLEHLLQQDPSHTLVRQEVNSLTTDGTPPLYIAAEGGHVEVVRLLLANEAVVNYQVEATGSTALFIAAQCGSLAVVEELLRAHAQVNLSREDGATPLFIACAAGHKAIVERLLSQQSGEEQRKSLERLSLGCSPLFIACQEGHVDCVRYLLALQPGWMVDTPIELDSHATPVVAASECGAHEIVKLLVDQGANINAQEADSGMSALMMALSQDFPILTRYLMEQPRLDLQHADHQGNNALLLGCENGSEASVRVFLRSLTTKLKKEQKKTYLKATNSLGRSALFLAAAYQLPGTVKELLNHEADPNQEDANGATPLFIATQRGSLDTIQCLLQHQAMPDLVRREDGIGPLHLLALLGEPVDGVALFVQHGASVDLRSAHGESPLYIACQENHVAMAVQLLSHRADPNLSVDGTSPLLLMCEDHRSSPLIEILLQAGADPQYVRPQDGISPQNFLGT